MSNRYGQLAFSADEITEFLGEINAAPSIAEVRRHRQRLTGAVHLDLVTAEESRTIGRALDDREERLLSREAA